MTNPNTLSSERPAMIEQLRAESRGLPYRPAKRKNTTPPPPPDPETARHLFTVFTGNRWIELGARQPATKMLFGHFWYQHELCILFANTNAGKSVLAVQIGNAIARRRKSGPFACQVGAARVLYADFELSTLQFHQRYSHTKRDYKFPDNFLRAQFNPQPHAGSNPDKHQHDELLMAGLEFPIRQLKPKVLIIDNISCLGIGTANATGCIRIMNRLNALRAQYQLSILVLAHTPKRRNNAAPLSTDDLQGSKLLINFADSAFTIGTSQTDSSLHYLKQIKQRSTQQVYGPNNVCLCRIQRPLNFLQFKFEGFGAERPLLLSRTQLQREKVAAEIARLAAENHTQRQISGELNIAVGTVNKLLNR